MDLEMSMLIGKSGVKEMQVLEPWIRACRPFYLQTERRENHAGTWQELFRTRPRGEARGTVERSAAAAFTGRIQRRLCRQRCGRRRVPRMDLRYHQSFEDQVAHHGRGRGRGRA